MRGEGLLNGLVAGEAILVEYCLAHCLSDIQAWVPKLNWANLDVESRGPKVFARDRIELEANEHLARR
jgi:hypothetical protein